MGSRTYQRRVGLASRTCGTAGATGAGELQRLWSHVQPRFLVMAEADLARRLGGRSSSNDLDGALDVASAARSMSSGSLLFRTTLTEARLTVSLSERLMKKGGSSQTN